MSRSGQRSKSSLFALSVTETGLKTAESPNFANASQRQRRQLIGIGLILSEDHGQGQVE